MDNQFVIIAMCVSAAVSLWSAIPGPHPDLQAVRKGEATLVCSFSDGSTRDVPADKVVTFNDDRSRWVFINGSAHASNCEVFPHAR